MLRRRAVLDYTILPKLEELAKSATPGRWLQDVPSWAHPWEIGVIREWTDEPCREIICSLDVKYGNAEDAPRAIEVDSDQVLADAAYIATACPDTILKLIQEICRLKAQVAYLTQ